MWKDSGLSSHPACRLITPTSLLHSPLLFNYSEEYGSGSPQYHSTLQMQLEEPYELCSFPRKEGKICMICTRDLCMDIKNSEKTPKDAKRKADQVQNFMDNQTHHLCDVPVGDAMQLQQHLEGDQGPGIGTVNPAVDGYNWRKYGQKQIKGSKYPRSYYRCTHPTCQVKKKVERALDGHITEIIYMGSHNHPKANPAGLPASETLHKQNGNASFSAVSPDEDSKLNCQEMASSVSGATEPSDLQANYSSSVAVDSYLSDLASQNRNEKGTTVGTMLFETGLKKRKKESCFVEMIAGSHSVQPKVVVQTVSEVDTLEDGYRWRKYGQKIVKGNPNPRSYYKCTTPGCSVRKQIERAAYDIRSVITSYEGKHNHEVPNARRSNSTCSSGIVKFPAHNSQTSFVTSEFTSLKPEPDKLVPGLRDNFETYCESLKSKSLLCTDDSEFLPLYQMMLQSSAPFLSGAFGLNTQQVIPMTKFGQELPIPYPPELSHSNFVVADDDISRSQCIGHEQEIR